MSSLYFQAVRKYLTCHLGIVALFAELVEDFTVEMFEILIFAIFCARNSTSKTSYIQSCILNYY